MWGPNLVEPKDQVAQWSQQSREVFEALAGDPASGVRLTSGIEASRRAEAAPDWATTLKEPLKSAPYGETVVLGGRAIDSDGSLALDDEAASAILYRCAQVEPLLTGTHVLGHRVGARPTRPRVRVEAGQRVDGKAVVHNYGHGGAGDTLPRGCAETVRGPLTDRL